MMEISPEVVREVGKEFIWTWTAASLLREAVSIVMWIFLVPLSLGLLAALIVVPIWVWNWVRDWVRDRFGPVRYR